MLEIRAVDRTDDHAAVGSIDTAFETSTIYALVAAPTRLDLVPQTLVTPRTKRYPIAEVFAPWSSWERGWIAEDGGVCGFAGVEYEAWHRRLVLWHLYVDRARRREGIGRALLQRVEDHGRTCGATRVWLETSTVNVPGIAAYARLGYTLCGVDAHYYEGTPVADEAAVYLSKPL